MMIVLTIYRHIFIDNIIIQSETGDKQLLLSYLNLKSLTKMSLKQELTSFIQSSLTYVAGHHVQVSRYFS